MKNQAVAILSLCFANFAACRSEVPSGGEMMNSISQEQLQYEVVENVIVETRDSMLVTCILPKGTMVNLESQPRVTSGYKDYLIKINKIQFPEVKGAETQVQVNHDQTAESGLLQLAEIHEGELPKLCGSQDQYLLRETLQIRADALLTREQIEKLKLNPAVDQGSAGDPGSKPAVQEEQREFNPKNAPGLMAFPKAGPGFETYHGSAMSYGQPKTIARIKELAKRVFAKTGLKLYVGDLSNRSGGNNGLHAGHYDGLEVDVAIMGNTASIWCSYFTDGCYNRRAQIAMIDEVIAMGGATSVYFLDPQVKSRFPQFVRQIQGHKDHVHINWHK